MHVGPDLAIVDVPELPGESDCGGQFADVLDHAMLPRHRQRRIDVRRSDSAPV